MMLADEKSQLRNSTYHLRKFLGRSCLGSKTTFLISSGSQDGHFCAVGETEHVHSLSFGKSSFLYGGRHHPRTALAKGMKRLT